MKTSVSSFMFVEREMPMKRTFHALRASSERKYFTMSAPIEVADDGAYLGTLGKGDAERGDDKRREERGRGTHYPARTKHTQRSSRAITCAKGSGSARRSRAKPACNEQD